MLYIIKRVIRATRDRKARAYSNRPEMTFSALDIDLRVTNVGYDTYSHENKIIIKMS